MKALLAAKRSPVRWGSQMCLNVRWVSTSFVFMQQKFHFHCVVVFFFGLLVTVTCMVSVGDSKHETVKPLQSLLNAQPLKSAQSASCTIHAVTSWPFLSFVILSFIFAALYYCPCIGVGKLFCRF
jgi:hypothetical protein